MLNRKLSFGLGLICGLAFAPVYFWPAIFSLSILCAQIYHSSTPKEAAIYGYWFGFGFFLSSLYWISFALLIYIYEFWWAFPFALLGLPAFLAFFIAGLSFISAFFRKNFFFHLIFCTCWIFMEWLISWVLTGLPWALIGYTFTFSSLWLQSVSIFGILGLSFIGVFIGSSLFNKKFITFRIFITGLFLISMTLYGYYREHNNPTSYSDIKVRIVQASIPQTSKWDTNLFWDNLAKQISLSKLDGSPDLIVWSEAALTVPFYYKPVYDALAGAFTKENQILLTGGVNDNRLSGNLFQVYSSLLAINNNELIFDYHKTHLVPFGEYMPLKSVIPLKKITHGFLDYTPGVRKLEYISSLNLKVHPLICYESIFFDEVRILNTKPDVIINITNDAWYGKSSGPFQHFEISRTRAIENGLPMVRAGNNGVSAVLDPLGRVVAKLKLNEINVIDHHLPYKLPSPTLYSLYGNNALYILVLGVLILQSLYLFTVLLFKEKKIFT